jgi:hypothetical protein
MRTRIVACRLSSGEGRNDRMHRPGLKLADDLDNRASSGTTTPTPR